MRIPENTLFSALQNGGRIKSFYRRAARSLRQDTSVLADGYVLETPGDTGETILSHTDFLSVRAKLVETETWEQTVGSVRFGGSTWVWRPEPDA
ncbi:cytoplasmic protein [Serratia marcescens]|uniref:Cytoplasmic protein n=1 Tax=Serratia marcescens TaxID=615 RepID=A0A5C7BSE4_SERMA|nr:cytoplasmic protein [Serratia marcescens]TXE55280.1 cytoplasmic protein [Serratia marcescens]